MRVPTSDETPEDPFNKRRGEVYIKSIIVSL